MDITSYCVKFNAGFNKGEVVAGTDYFRQQAKALPVLKPATCPDSEVANCVVLYSNIFKQFVSYEEGKEITLKKENDDSARWIWNMKSPTLNEKTRNPQSVLVHAKSGLALSVDKHTHKLVMVPRDQGKTWERTMDGGSFRCVSCKTSKTEKKKSLIEKAKGLVSSAKNFFSSSDKKAEKKTPHAPSEKMPYVLAVSMTANKDEKLKMDGTDKLKLEAMKPSDYDKLDSAARGVRTVLEFVAAEAKTEQKWSDFFNEFGTHFISTLKLGGKLVHSTVMSQEDSETMDQSGFSAAAAVEVATATFSAKGSVEGGKQKESMTAFSKMEKTEKTTVLGGNPPPSGAEDPAGFAEWAETVTDAPMPVKITLRPLSAVGGEETGREHFSHTFDVMVAKYMSNTIARSKADYLQAGWAKKEGAGGTGAGGAGDKPPTLTPGGAPLMSDGKPFLWDDYSLVVTNEGALQIKNHKLDAVLWDSLVTDQGWGAPSTGVATPGGPYRLQYQTDGNLVILNKANQMIWQTQTKASTCGGKMPKKVEFDGDLAVFTEGEKTPVWHAGTKAISETAAKSKASIAKAPFFGGGKNTCIKADNCVKLYYEYNFKDDGQNQKALAPGSYSREAAMPNFVGDVNSIKVDEDNCWYRSWNEDDYTDESDFATTSVKDTTEGWTSKGGAKCAPQVDDDIYSIRVFRRWVSATVVSPMCCPGWDLAPDSVIFNWCAHACLLISLTHAFPTDRSLTHRMFKCWNGSETRKGGTTATARRVVHLFVPRLTLWEIVSKSITPAGADIFRTALFPSLRRSIAHDVR